MLSKKELKAMESFGDPIVCATHSHQLSASFHKNVLGNGSGGEETFNASTSVLRLKKLSRAELSQIFVFLFSKIVRHLIKCLLYMRLWCWTFFYRLC